MLRTNLSTRPFYNVTIVRAGLGILALLVIAISGFNVLQVISLNSRERTLSGRATAALAEASRLRMEAQRIRAQVDPKELETVSAAALEANAAIEQKAFSWEQLLAQLEATLPDDVRATSIQPRIDDGVIKVSLTVKAKTDNDLALFMDALEGKGTFKDVLPSRDEHGEDDIIDATIEATYVPPPRAESAETSAKTSGEGDRE